MTLSPHVLQHYPKQGKSVQACKNERYEHHESPKP